MIEIRVTNSTEAMHILHSERIPHVKIVDDDIIEVSPSDWLDTLDILADEGVLSDVAELADKCTT